MTDIYGAQIDTLECRGLADADDEDLHVKLMSLQTVWDDIIPGFHQWFVKNRLDIFKRSLIMSSGEKLKIDGKCYSNGLELKHRLLKKKLSDISSSAAVRTASENLRKWLKENFQDEVEKALEGQGKYRLAASCQQFFVDPTIWLRWSISRRQRNLESFLSFIPRSYKKFKKLSDAGFKKKPGQKRRGSLPQADIFVDIILHLIQMQQHQ